MEEVPRPESGYGHEIEGADPGIKQEIAETLFEALDYLVYNRLGVDGDGLPRALRPGQSLELDRGHEYNGRRESWDFSTTVTQLEGNGYRYETALALFSPADEDSQELNLSLDVYPRSYAARISQCYEGRPENGPRQWTFPSPREADLFAEYWIMALEKNSGEPG